ncbi:MAG: hypothetical protein MUF21_06145 [Gemmatimonadaceae bacterium]|nr:hypothetical protein [Gemmatimonadaceae bacterium]
MALPHGLAARWPELSRVRWRVDGLPLRVGGWCLGQRTVTGITLGRTVFLAPGTPWAPRLLLHELRHVEHFSAVPAFPLRYVCESLVRGYARNRYEVDADAFATARLAGAPPPPLPLPGA